jgi:hypothetical protein
VLNHPHCTTELQIRKVAYYHCAIWLIILESLTLSIPITRCFELWTVCDVLYDAVIPVTQESWPPSSPIFTTITRNLVSYSKEVWLIFTLSQIWKHSSRHNHLKCCGNEELSLQGVYSVGRTRTLTWGESFFSSYWQEIGQHCVHSSWNPKSSRVHKGPPVSPSTFHTMLLQQTF